MQACGPKSVWRRVRLVYGSNGAPDMLPLCTTLAVLALEP